MTKAPEPKDKLDATTTVVANGPEDAILDWDAVDWRACEESVRRLRQRIFTASRAGDLARVRSLQKLMLCSRANALLSVRRVSERNAGRLTAGIDGEVALTSKAKANLVARMQRKTEPFVALPVRRVYIPKPGSAEAPPVRDSDGHVIQHGSPTSFWVRWWSRIRSIRCAVSGLMFCMCVVSRPVACMCALPAAVEMSRWMRRRPIAALSLPSGR